MKYAPKEKPKKEAFDALSNLRQFKMSKKLGEVAIQFMVKNLATREELKELQLAFDALDSSGDGKIEKDELIKAFGAFSEDAIAEVEAIFAEVDLDRNGEIEFSEWVVASIDKGSLLT